MDEVTLNVRANTTTWLNFFLDIRWSITNQYCYNVTHDGSSCSVKIQMPPQPQYVINPKHHLMIHRNTSDGLEKHMKVQPHQIGIMQQNDRIMIIIQLTKKQESHNFHPKWRTIYLKLFARIYANWIIQHCIKAHVFIQ